MSTTTSEIIRSVACDIIMAAVFHNTPTEEPEEHRFALAFECLSEIFQTMHQANEMTHIDLTEMVIGEYKRRGKTFECFQLFTQYLEFLKNREGHPQAKQYHAFTYLHTVLKYGHLIDKDYCFRCIRAAQGIFKETITATSKWGLALTYYLHARILGMHAEGDEEIRVGTRSKLLDKATREAAAFLENTKVTKSALSQTTVCPAYYMACICAAHQKYEGAFFFLTQARQQSIGCPEASAIANNIDFTTIKDRFSDFRTILSEPQQYLKERLAFMQERKNYLQKQTGAIQPHLLDSQPTGQSMLGQSTLGRDALSRSTLEDLQINPLGLAINLKAFFEPIKSSETAQAEARLRERMELYGLEHKKHIPGDGNCQMYSLSDQLTGSIRHAAFIRRTLVRWLREHADVVLPNGAKLTDFACDRKWEDWCAEMAADKTWGDHLTLIAAAEAFCCNILILSSIPGDHFIIEIYPTLGEDAISSYNRHLTEVPPNHLLMLSHFSEFHYGSMEQKTV